jgi:hypothetical protein
LAELNESGHVHVHDHVNDHEELAHVNVDLLDLGVDFDVVVHVDVAGF